MQCKQKRKETKNCALGNSDVTLEIICIAIRELCP